MTASYAPYAAWPSGSDPSALRREAACAHEVFLATGALAGLPLREVVLDSWRRSRNRGIDPESACPGSAALATPELRDYRTGHPLAPVLPVIRRLLLESAPDDGQLLAVGDARGRLLWVEGSPALVARAERIGFAEGADWAEEAAGTNAPGTALALGRPVQIYASEHFSRPVQAWSCSAAPVRDPDTGAVLGVVDLTGGDHIAAPHALALVRATVAAAEAELRLLRLQRILPAPRSQSAHLAVLGRDRARLTSPYGSLELSPRHSEIVYLLARHPRGLSAEALAVRLHEEEGARVTVRAEMSRLRRFLGPALLASRPYRLLLPLTTDADAVHAHLAHGAPAQALTAYPGPLLPRSDSPAVVEARDELACELRRVLRHHRDPGLLLTWIGRPEHEDDLEMLQAAADALPPGSPRALTLRTRLDRALR